MAGPLVIVVAHWRPTIPLEASVVRGDEIRPAQGTFKRPDERVAASPDKHVAATDTTSGSKAALRLQHIANSKKEGLTVTNWTLRRHVEAG